MVAFLAGCQAARTPQVRETSAELPSRTFVSVQRLADKLDLDYLGEADGFIEMSTAPDYVMLARDSRNAVINGEQVAMGQPCLRRGNDYVVSAGDAELVSTKLSSLRSGRKPVEAISLVITPSPSSGGLPAEWQPRAGVRVREWQGKVVHHAAMPSGDDLALARFTSRTHGASQVVGYNKAAMVFFMLRDRLGPDRFVDGIRRFWEKEQFHIASWQDLQTAYEPPRSPPWAAS